MNADMDVAWAFWLGLVVATLILACDLGARWQQRRQQRHTEHRRADVRKILGPVRPDEYEPDSWWW